MGAWRWVAFLVLVGGSDAAAKTLCVEVAAPGLTASRVEMSIVIPVEQAVAELAQEIRSVAHPGHGRVCWTVPWLQWVAGNAVGQAHAALVRVSSLFPPGVEAPVLRQVEASEVSTLPSGVPAVWLAVVASDNNRAARVAGELRKALILRPGLDARVLSDRSEPEVHVRFDREALAKRGVDQVSAASALRTAKKPGVSVEQLGQLVVATTGGAVVRLSDVATLELRRAPSLLHRRNAKRVALVELGSAHGRAAAKEAFVAVLEDLSLPKGVTVTLVSNAEPR